MHGHYFGLTLLLEELAKRHSVAFTVRTHSMDMLSEPEEKIGLLCRAANSPWCLRLLVFPSFRERLIERGVAADRVVACWPAINFSRFYRPERRAATGRVMCGGPAVRKKAHTDFVDLAAMMKGSGFDFDLYARGASLDATRQHNERAGHPVRITYADPDDMPDVYPRYDWLVYPSDTKMNKVGLPVGIAEAQASGLGVCWQELPGRRDEQLEFLGGAGFLFSSIDEVPAIISKPYPEEMRLRGLDNVQKCDIERHKHLLSDVWAPAARTPAA
jgi:glycosyltransferase involved in cell wall biosynthesis